MSNVIKLPSPQSEMIISDETMSELPSDLLAWRIWNSLNGLDDAVATDNVEEWRASQHEVYCDILEALICARVLARRLIGVEPSEIAAELHRRFLIAAGLPVDGGGL